MNNMNTAEETREVIKTCRSLFEKKLHDYGTAWRIMRIPSVTDQLLIKANRIRTLEEKGEALVDEGIVPEFIGLVNYSIIGMIQLSLKSDEPTELPVSQAMELYDKYAQSTLELMGRKNHDYGEIWRDMRISSYTDLILMKVFRTKQIEDLGGKTLVSEGIEANYMDILNYAVFALIKLVVENTEAE